MSKLYVNELVPRDASVITAPNLQLPAGSVVQVVQGTLLITDTSISSSSYIATNLKATITPKSISNKILILIHCHLQVQSGTSMPIALYRNGSNIVSRLVSLSNPVADGQPASANWLDSPSSISALEYEVYALNENTSYSAKFGNQSASGIAFNTITLMEIAQ